MPDQTQSLFFSIANIRPATWSGVSSSGRILIREPPLKDVELDSAEAEQIYQKIVEYISLLYNQAGLVHADLSEFNILYDNGEPVIIDMGQSVTLDHPMARKFLERDISNIVHYFQKKYSIGSSEEIYSRIQKDEAEKIKKRE